MEPALLCHMNNLDVWSPQESGCPQQTQFHLESGGRYAEVQVEQSVEVTTRASEPRCQFLNRSDRDVVQRQAFKNLIHAVIFEAGSAFRPVPAQLLHFARKEHPRDAKQLGAMFETDILRDPAQLLMAGSRQGKRSGMEPGVFKEIQPPRQNPNFSRARQQEKILHQHNEAPGGKARFVRRGQPAPIRVPKDQNISLTNGLSVPVRHAEC